MSPTSYQAAPPRVKDTTRVDDASQPSAGERAMDCVAVRANISIAGTALPDQNGGLLDGGLVLWARSYMLDAAAALNRNAI